MSQSEHRQLADALRKRVISTPAETTEALRRGAVARAAGGQPITEPHDALVHQVAEAASRVTDGQVGAVREALGSDKAAFELVMAAAIGAGLKRWDKAMEALDAAS